MVAIKRTQKNGPVQSEELQDTIVIDSTQTFCQLLTSLCLFFLCMRLSKIFSPSFLFLFFNDWVFNFKYYKIKYNYYYIYIMMIDGFGSLKTYSMGKEKRY